MGHEYKVCMTPAFCDWHRAKFWHRVASIIAEFNEQQRAMNPPGSVGEAFQQMDRRIEALPWYCWPLKVRLRRTLRGSRQRMTARRNKFLADFFSS